MSSPEGQLKIFMSLIELYLEIKCYLCGKPSKIDAITSSSGGTEAVTYVMALAFLILQ